MTLLKSLSLALFCLTISHAGLTQKARADSAAQPPDQFDVLTIEYPPFAGEKLVGHGLNFRLLDRFAKSHLKAPPKPKFLPPARIQAFMARDRWCMSVYPPRETIKMAEFVPLSNQMVKLGLYRKTQTTPFSWTDLSELSGQKLAIFRSIASGSLHNQLEGSGLELHFIDTLEQGFKLVLNDRVDALFADELSLKSSPYAQERANDLQFSKKPLMNIQVGFYFNRACAEDIFKEGSLYLLR